MNETVEDMIRERKIKYWIACTLITVVILINMWGWSLMWQFLAEEPDLFWPKPLLLGHMLLVLWMTIRLILVSRYHYETLNLVDLILKAKEEASSE
jgi:hypothetical protein